MIPSATTSIKAGRDAEDLASMTPLDWALQYAALGWSVLPLHYPTVDGCSCRKRNCDRAGKHPLGALAEHGLKDATTDADIVRRWWQSRPEANIGIRTSERDGIFMVGPDGAEGIAQFAELQQRYGPVPRTPMQRSGGNGEHHFFQWPAGIKIPNGFNIHGRLIDVRGENGYAVAAPSKHKSGGFYDWLVPPWEPLATPPGWLVKWILEGDPKEKKPPPPPQPSTDGIHMAGRATSGADILTRARKYLDRHPIAISGQGGHSTAMSAARAVVWGFGINGSEALDLLREWSDRCLPPWSDTELRHKIDDAGQPDPLGRPEGYLRDAERNGATSSSASPSPGGSPPPSSSASGGPADGRKLPKRWTIGELQDAYPTMRPPVIDGLVREGETLNIIAPTKIGKSWLSYSLLLSIVTGKPWFGRFPTTQGKVLLIDNELHRETIAQRLRFVANALGIARDEYRDLIELYSLRGGLLDINAIHELIDPIRPYEFRLLLVDAKYRMLPVGTSENANEDETHFYNRVDQYADATRAVWSNIHHSTKGNQSGKSVTDTGAGGGAQSRAADCHLVLREHEQDGIFVLEAAVRSFAPVEPLALRWQFPLWIPADDVDPSALKGRLSAQDSKQRAKDQEAMMEIETALIGGPLSQRAIRTATGFGSERTNRLLSLMLATGRIETVAGGIAGNECTLYRLPISA